MRGEVCIIGAGPAGVVSGKVFDRDGYDVTIYEQNDEIGGTWSSDGRYVELNAQADRGLLEFADEPNDEPFMDAEDVQEYVRAYAEKFGVTDDVHLGAEVVDLRQLGDRWQVTVDTQLGTVTDTYDYVVVCSGMHHEPHVPDVPGGATFEGETYHSSEVDSHEALADRDVAMVGFGKSALDLSVEAARVADSTTMVFRQPHWHVPRKLIGGLVPYRYVLFSRLGESILPRYYNDDAVRAIDRVPQWVKDLAWKAMAADVAVSAGLRDADDSLVPETSPKYALHRVSAYPPDFVDLVAEGAIRPKQAAIERFEEDGLRLDTGETVDVDTVVWGTGFDQSFPFLPEELGLVTDDDHLRAYRYIVPPDVDGIGFVGFRQAFNNFLTMEVSAHWLSAYFGEELDPMPTGPEMEAAIDRRIQWREDLPGTDGMGPVPYAAHLTDELLEDLGVPKNQAPNPLAEYFAPVKARWYDDLHRERAKATSQAIGEGTDTIFDRASGTLRRMIAGVR